jgi:replicative DNA helicase
MPGKDADHFWHGNEDFFKDAFKIFNVQEIDRCERGTLFVTEGENNLLLIKELGYPGIAVPSLSVLDHLTPDRTAHLRHIFLLLNNNAESQLAARNLGTRLGFKVRIVHWPSHTRRGYGLTDLSREEGDRFRHAFARLLNRSKAFSPFSSPEREHRQVFETLEQHQGKALIGFETGFAQLDQALDGVRGINIMGGPPKAGKSCFFLQVSTEMALRRQPVIYYDFENGRRKIYTRTLIRLTGISNHDLRQIERSEAITRKLKKSRDQFKQLLNYFRVITDRTLSPEIMRRHIDFLQHETRQERVLVVVDSLHKLPFKDLGERRTGIDSWLRNLEAIRDELNVAFLVISELSRGQAGGYDDKPDLGAFKESGDIEYSADNAMVLLPNWDPVDPISTSKRRITLWMVASRENSPGRIADYQLDYPYWRFDEV